MDFALVSKIEYGLCYEKLKLDCTHSIKEVITG